MCVCVCVCKIGMEEWKYQCMEWSQDQSTLCQFVDWEIPQVDPTTQTVVQLVSE